MNLIVVVMGVAGCGKTTLGQALAAAWGEPFIEGDDFHPPANVAKMRAGQPLNDQDRAGWLDALQGELRRHPCAVLSCSALKRAYRDRLRQARPDLRFVHAAISREEAARRLRQRKRHFFPASLVDSQFAALEPPNHEAGVCTVDATLPVTDLVAQLTVWRDIALDGQDPTR
jgi:gluconokinase